MDKDTQQLYTELKAINAILQQIKEDLAQVKAEVHLIHTDVADLPTGEKWVPSTTR